MTSSNTDDLLKGDLLGICGNQFIVISIDTGEAIKFGDLGGFNSDMGSCGAAILQSKSFIKVDFLSLLGDSDDICEIYFKKRRLVVNKQYMDVVKLLPKGENLASPVLFRIGKREGFPGVQQVIYAYKRDCISHETISNCLGLPVSEWK